MFDAKSLFEQMVKGANPSSAQQGGPSAGMADLGDLLRQFTQQGGGAATSGAGSSSGGRTEDNPDSSAGSALNDLMRQFTQDRDDESVGKSTQNGTSERGGSSALEDLMRQFTQGDQSSQSRQSGGHQMQELPDVGSGGGTGSSAPSSTGGLGDLLGQMFGQGGAPSSGSSSPASPSANQTPNIKDLLEQFGVSGAGSSDLVRQLTDFIGNNKIGTGAALGGLGALIFGTQTGRSLAANAAKLGALAVVGGLAYKAYQNYNQGRPLVSGAQAPEAPPSGSGFEAEEVSNSAAVTYIRGMIAAAAADGRLDANEQQRILGTLSDQGLDAGAEEFLAKELNNPASIDELIAGVSNQTEGLQLYTAARVSIEPDTGAEQQFLAVLADRLGIAPELRAHVDAAARGMA